MLKQFWLLVLVAVAACSSAPKVSEDFGRCIWVDRWDWRTAADIERIMGDCQAAGFTTVLFQVRGNGTALWRSKLDVWGDQFGFQDPGFDPLQVAVDAAHRRSLQLHAWINVFPGWVGDKDPTDQRQLWRSRRDWFLQDREGRFQSRKAGKYLALNPCRKEVRDYLTALGQELVTQYAIDGLHLDYVRFPDPEGDDVDALGLDSLSLSLFRAATGKVASDTVAVKRWQTQCVTATVAALREVTKAAGRRCLLTASVFADRQKALAAVRQDWPEWCKKGLIDALLPMNYTADDGLFSNRVADAVAHSRGVPVIVGVGIYQHGTADQSVRQLDVAMTQGANGVAVFNYRTMFGKSDKNTPAQQQEFRQRFGAWQVGGERRR